MQGPRNANARLHRALGTSATPPPAPADSNSTEQHVRIKLARCHASANTRQWSLSRIPPPLLRLLAAEAVSVTGADSFENRNHCNEPSDRSVSVTHVGPPSATRTACETETYKSRKSRICAVHKRHTRARNNAMRYQTAQRRLELRRPQSQTSSFGMSLRATWPARHSASSRARWRPHTSNAASHTCACKAASLQYCSKLLMYDSRHDVLAPLRPSSDATLLAVQPPTHTHTHAHTHARTHTCTHTPHAHTHAHMHTCTHAHTHAAVTHAAHTHTCTHARSR